MLPFPLLPVIRYRKRHSGFREDRLVASRKGKTCGWENETGSHFQVLRLARFPKSEMASGSRSNPGVALRRLRCALRKI